MRRLLTALPVLALLAVAAPAAAQSPAASTRFAVGTPAMTAAQGIARQHWGMDACSGQVEVVWDALPANVNARSTWQNPTSAYDNPAENNACKVVFNATTHFDWAEFCTVLVHEYGHLTGHEHTADGDGVMSPIYRAPLRACTDVPDPSGVERAHVSRHRAHSRVHARAHSRRAHARGRHAVRSRSRS